MSELSLLVLTFHGEFGWVCELLVSKSFSHRTLTTFLHCALEFRVVDEKDNTSVIHVLLLVTSFVFLFGIS